MNRLLVGAVTGLIAGLLLAPQTGKESREIVKERFNSVRDALMKMRSANGEESQESLESAVRADYLH
jgi:gas vesicle protein